MAHYIHGKKKNFSYTIASIKYYRNYRGKGDYFRLGHGSNDHVRKPKPVSGLHGKKIVQFSTGLNTLLKHF